MIEFNNKINEIVMKNLVMVTVCSIALSACMGAQMENFENKKSKHERQEEKFQRKVNRTKDIIDNNARKQDPSYRHHAPSLPSYGAPPYSF